eukprot:6201648-Pleurochrysis_carterae.AAC.3
MCTVLALPTKRRTPCCAYLRHDGIAHEAEADLLHFLVEDEVVLLKQQSDGQLSSLLLRKFKKKGAGGVEDGGNDMQGPLRIVTTR